MGHSNNSSVGLANSLRLGFAVLLALVICASSTLLLFEGEYWFASGLFGLGLIMLGVCYWSYRACKRPEAARDERTQQYHERAGFNAFWAVIFGSCMYGFYPIAPTFLTKQIEASGATVPEIAWATSLCLGVLVYIITWGVITLSG